MFLLLHICCYTSDTSPMLPHAAVDSLTASIVAPIISLPAAVPISQTSISTVSTSSVATNHPATIDLTPDSTTMRPSLAPAPPHPFGIPYPCIAAACVFSRAVTSWFWFFLSTISAVESVYRTYRTASDPANGGFNLKPNLCYTTSCCGTNLP